VIFLERSFNDTKSLCWNQGMSLIALYKTFEFLVPVFI